MASNASLISASMILVVLLALYGYVTLREYGMSASSNTAAAELSLEALDGGEINAAP